MTGREMLTMVLKDLSARAAVPALNDDKAFLEAVEGLAEIIASRIESDAQESFLATLEKVLAEELAG